jgi:hypothetical protein
VAFEGHRSAEIVEVFWRLSVYLTAPEPLACWLSKSLLEGAALTHRSPWIRFRPARSGSEHGPAAADRGGGTPKTWSRREIESPLANLCVIFFKTRFP